MYNTVKKTQGDTAMYMNYGYLGDMHEDIVDTAVPLLVSSAGNYKITDTGELKTERPHGRGDYQLIYVCQGKLRLFEKGKETSVPTGSLIVFRPGEPQVYHLYAKDKPETFWVHFTGCEVESLLCRYGITRDTRTYFIGSSPNNVWLFRQMIMELQFRRHNFLDLLRINLKSLLILAGRAMKERGDNSSSAQNEAEVAALYFAENYTRPISVRDYAAKRHISECYFNKIFKATFNVTPMQYVISLRIAGAKKLLEGSDMDVIRISSAVGYDDAFYFSRLFKKHTGQSPTEYRRQFKKAHGE